MNIQIEPGKLSGTVTPPPSKSMAHRLLIAAALADGTSTLHHVAFSRDIEATLRCMEALGAEWSRLPGDAIQVRGLQPRPAGELPHLNCGESGSTLRFLIPIALAVAGGGVFTGQGRLMERPQQPYFDLFDEKGIFWQQENGVLTVRGRLTPGEYRLPGNVSSQFFTGLLFALALLEGDSTVVSTTALESVDYIGMTLNAMQTAGVPIAAQWGQNRFTVSPTAYRPFEGTVEADWSQAGFWYAAAFLDDQVQLQGLDPLSAQGDKVISELYWRLARPGDAEIDISGCPDLLPPLAVMAAVRSGTTHFVNAARLRMKESDRLSTVAALLTALGGQAEEGPDSLAVHGVPALTGGVVDGANDHRIVMAAAIAATSCSAPVTILGAEAVSKSYPNFWEEYQRLGGVFHVL